MPNTLDHLSLQQFSRLELIARQVVEGFITGMHKSPFHGFSVEFAEHRSYNTGESTKNIDWKLYGRTDKLFVKKYEEETNLRCQFIIDASSSMYYPREFDLSKEQFNKISFAAYAAGALIYLLKTQRDATGLSIFTDELKLHTKARSSNVHHKILFHELEKIIQEREATDKQKTRTGEILHQLAEKIHKRSLIIIFSDMMETECNSNEMFSALQHLKHNKHEVILFHVVDKNKEYNFDFKNHPYRFIDMETDKEIKLKPYQVRDAYIKALSDYEKELKLKCMQYKIDFVEADINKGFIPILQSYLIKRKKLF